MRVTSKGQVTIPIKIREKLGLLPNTEVEFSVHGNNAIIKRAANSPRDQNVLRTMRGRATESLSTDEIMALTRGR